MSSEKESQNTSNKPKRIQDDEIKAQLKHLPGWDVVVVSNIPRLKKDFLFNNFVKALQFTNDIGAIAELHDHHPLIELSWGRVSVSWWTHDINGLQEKDFLLAAKTNALLNKEKMP